MRPNEPLLYEQKIGEGANDKFLSRFTKQNNWLQKTWTCVRGSE